MSRNTNETPTLEEFNAEYNKKLAVNPFSKKDIVNIVNEGIENDAISIPPQEAGTKLYFHTFDVNSTHSVKLLTTDGTTQLNNAVNLYAAREKVLLAYYDGTIGYLVGTPSSMGIIHISQTGSDTYGVLKNVISSYAQADTITEL